MSLYDTVRKGAATAYKVVDSMLLDAVYTSTGTAGYDPATGDVTNVGDQTFNIRVLREEYSDQQINGQNIRATDKRFSWSDVMYPGFEPKTDDYLVLTATGERWNVVRKMVDPVNAAWIVQARK